jgi:hypothetical protein
VTAITALVVTLVYILNLGKFGQLETQYPNKGENVMKARGFRAFLFATILVGSVVSPGHTEAAADGCHKINAKIFLIGPITPPECQSPLGICNRGGFIGGGLLNGTWQSTLLGAAPAAGIGDPVPPTTLSVVEEIVITTRHGTLTTRSIGIFDAATGTLIGLPRIVGGTGRFEGATGTFELSFSFNEGEGEWTGELCLGG